MTLRTAEIFSTLPTPLTFTRRCCRYLAFCYSPNPTNDDWTARTLLSDCSHHHSFFSQCLHSTRSLRTALSLRGSRCACHAPRPTQPSHDSRRLLPCHRWTLSRLCVLSRSKTGATCHFGSLCASFHCLTVAFHFDGNSNVTRHLFCFLSPLPSFHCLPVWFSPTRSTSILQYGQLAPSPVCQLYRC